MTIVLATKPGINGANTLSIPTAWDATWFRKFIANSLKGADVRNAVGVNGIVVSGTIASPYATIGFGPGPVILQPGPAGSITLTVSGAANANSALQVSPGAGGTFSAVFNTLPIEINSAGVNQIILNSTGADFGAIANPSPQNWSLGYTASPGTLATAALTWNTAGAIKVAGAFCCNGVATPNGADSGWGTPTGAILTTNFPGATATLQQTSESLARIILIMKNFGFLST